MGATVAARPLVARRFPGRGAAVLGVGGIAAVALLLAGVALGSADVALGDSAAILARRLVGLPLAETWSRSAETIVLELRLPRVLTAMLVGGALALAGAVFQALLRNPMADPYVIGSAAGASLGAVAGLLLPSLVPALAVGAGSLWLGIGAAQLLAFVGGLATVLTVYAVARAGSRVPVESLLLTGYAVSAVLAAAVALLMFFSGRALGAIFAWLTGSLSGSSWPPLALAAPLIAVSAALLALRWRRLNVLLLGDAAAAHLGIDVERDKLVLTVLAALATSAAVAISGLIGFVGLVVPHVLRLLVGPDHRLLLPACVFYGAVLLAAADLGARLAGGIPVGILTALLGAPFFVWLLRRGRAARLEAAS